MHNVTITLNNIIYKYESVSYNLGGGASDTKHMMNDNTYVCLWNELGYDLKKAPRNKVKEK